MSKKMTKNEVRVSISKIALARIELCQQRIVAFQFATNIIAEKASRRGDKRYQEADRIVHEHLIKDLHDAYETMFMWSSLLPEVRKDARRIAYGKFLSETKAIMHLLDINGRPPDCYLQGDRELLQEMIDEAMAEAEKDESCNDGSETVAERAENGRE